MENTKWLTSIVDKLTELEKDSNLKQSKELFTPFSLLGEDIVKNYDKDNQLDRIVYEKLDHYSNDYIGLYGNNTYKKLDTFTNTVMRIRAVLADAWDTTNSITITKNITKLLRDVQPKIRESIAKLDIRNFRQLLIDNENNVKYLINDILADSEIGFLIGYYGRGRGSLTRNTIVVLTNSMSDKELVKYFKRFSNYNPYQRGGWFVNKYKTGGYGETRELIGY